MNLTRSIPGHQQKKETLSRSELLAAAALTHSIPQFCRLVGISPATGRALAKAGGIPTIELGKRRRVPDWALRELTQPEGTKR